MTSPDDRDQNRRRREEEDAFTRPARNIDSHVTSLFDTLWGLPSQIYQRGNEHGREFSRMMDERHQRHTQYEHESRGEREEEQEREDGRGSKACGWRGRDRWHHARHQRRQENESRHNNEGTEGTAQQASTTEDWVKRITQEVDRNQQEAERLYADFEKKVHQARPNGDDDDFPQFVREMSEMVKDILGPPTNYTQRSEDAVEKTATQNKNAQSWSEVFPAWSGASAASDEKQHEAFDANTVIHQPSRHGPIVATAQQIEDAINQAHAELAAIMRGTSNMARHMKEGYHREARVWGNEGLFGSQVPFSGPLSALFSMGIKPFLPPDSAMGYLIASEYSPLHLEHEEGFDRTFRRRFEDLIRVQSGREMRGEDEPLETTQVEWLARVQTLLRNHEHDNDHSDWSSEHFHGAQSEQIRTADASETELDVYERQLPEQSAAVVSWAQKTRPEDTSKYSADSTSITQVVNTASHEAPGILSTLTTTERHVAADGTVTEKTILKKRFADGREETESSTTTTEANPSASWVRNRHRDQNARHEEEQLPVSKIAKEAKRSGGWFWSS